MRLNFQQRLGDLKERVLVMAGMAEQAIQRFEREIDQMALDLPAMEQPLANDLRFTLAVIKINPDLVRIGNAAGMDAGLKVAPVNGWENRGRGDVGHTVGVLCHHTAGQGTAICRA